MNVKDAVARFDPNELTLGDRQDLKHAGIPMSDATDLSDPDTMVAIVKCVIRHADPEFEHAGFNDPALVAAARNVKLVELYGDDEDEDEGDEDPTSPGSRPGADDDSKPAKRSSKSKAKGSA